MLTLTIWNVMMSTKIGFYIDRDINVNNIMVSMQKT